MKLLLVNLFTLLILIAYACGSSSAEDTSDSAAKPKSMLADEADPLQNKGIGPITELKLGAEIDQAMVVKGEEVFKKMCTACHKPAEKFIGPAPKGIFEKRSPEWIMNMILNPEQMVKEDPDAKKLLVEYNMSPMANQNLTQEEARAVLEYFRTL